MNAIEAALAKLNKYRADMESDIAIIDDLTARIRIHAEAMKTKGPTISLAMGWAR